MAERTVGPRGKVVSVYLSVDSIELIDKVSKAFQISRSEVLDAVVRSKSEELREAASYKAISYQVEPDSTGGEGWKN